MDCEILRTLYLKSNGEVPCHDDFGEQIRLSKVDLSDPSWSIAQVFEGESYRTIRSALSTDRVPWDGVCQRCAFLRPKLPLRDTLARRTITRMQVEPSLACNLACPCCSNAEQRRTRARPHVMPIETFAAVLRSLREHDYTLECVEYCGQGEPLMHPQFSEFVALARTLFPHARQRLITNGNFDYHRVLKGQALDEIYVACDGARQQSYEQYRRKGDLDQALEFMRAVPRRLGGRRQLLLWKYILFEYNDSPEELIEAQKAAERLGVDILQFVLTHSEHRSPTFTLKSLEALPVVSARTVVEPCAAFYEGARYGRRLSTDIRVMQPTKWRPSLRPSLDRDAFRAHLDEVVYFEQGALVLRGWAGATTKLTHVKVICGDTQLGTVRLSRSRDDVLAAHPAFKDQRTGFCLIAPAPSPMPDEAWFAVDAFCDRTRVGRLAETYSFV